DVNVAGALLNRRHQDDVDQPDDRRILALFGEGFRADLLHLLEDFHVVGVAAERVLQLLEALARHLQRAAAVRGTAFAALARGRAPGARLAARVVLLD